MAKISLVLVFSLVLALPFRSVLSQEDSWKDLIGKGSFSQGTIDEAKKAFGGSGEAAGDALFDDGEEGSSLADLIETDKGRGSPASAPTAKVSKESPVGAPEDLPTDGVFKDEDGSPAEAPKDSSEAGSPTEAPKLAATGDDDDDAPEQAPTDAPTNAPFEAPAANAPTQTSQVSPTPTDASELAPTNAPEEGGPPTDTPTGTPEGEPDDGDEEEEIEWAPPTEAPEGEPSDASEQD